MPISNFPTKIFEVSILPSSDGNLGSICSNIIYSITLSRLCPKHIHMNLLRSLRIFEGIRRPEALSLAQSNLTKFSFPHLSSTEAISIQSRLQTKRTLIDSELSTSLFSLTSIRSGQLDLLEATCFRISGLFVSPTVRLLATSLKFPDTPEIERHLKLSVEHTGFEKPHLVHVFIWSSNGLVQATDRQKRHVFRQMRDIYLQKV